MPVEMPTEILVNAVTTLAARNKRRAEERRALQKQLSDFPPATDRHRAWMERRIAELEDEEAVHPRDHRSNAPHQRASGSLTFP